VNRAPNGIAAVCGDARAVFLRQAQLARQFRDAHPLIHYLACQLRCGGNQLWTRGAWLARRTPYAWGPGMSLTPTIRRIRPTTRPVTLGIDPLTFACTGHVPPLASTTVTARRRPETIWRDRQLLCLGLAEPAAGVLSPACSRRLDRPSERQPFTVNILARPSSRWPAHLQSPGYKFAGVKLDALTWLSTGTADTFAFPVRAAHRY